MPPKNNITLGPGTLYFSDPDGLHPLGEIQKLEYTEEEYTAAEKDLIPIGKMFRTAAQKTMGITLEAKISRETMEFIMNKVDMIVARSRWRAMCLYYPNPRVVHLANHHGDPLVRKKNAKRILRHFGFFDQQRRKQ